MSGNSSKRDARAVEDAELTRQCLELRIAGATLEEIGRAVDLHKSNVSRRIRAAVASIPAEQAESLRSMENQRLDRMQKAIWNQVRQGHLGAIDRAIRISERRSRLNGLDAPQQVDLGVKAVDIDSVAQDIMRAVSLPLAGDEADAPGVT